MINLRKTIYLASTTSDVVTADIPLTTSASRKRQQNNNQLLDLVGGVIQETAAIDDIQSRVCN